MDTTSRPETPGPASSSIRSALRRGLGAAGAAVAVAFVGTAALGAGQGHAAGISGGLTPVPASAPSAPHPHRHHAAHPANLPAATSTAYRYSFREGQLIRV
ncbi:hypothetical protein GCM10009817_23500 [Terrabacter lapilli]|uniref:Uncharacterized protein n=1 Tax=Terrabacter lapilli TaxID=436231 RepID=A0ABP5DP27_9MICO